MTTSPMRPLLHRGAVIFADWSGNVYRADARSGELLWKKKIEEAENEWVWHGLAGTGTVGQGLLFEASVEGHAFALNPDSGEMLWKTRISKDPHAGNVGELLYHDGLLYIGLSSVEETLDGMIPDFEPDFCGEVIALEAATGKIAWRCPVVEPPHNGVGIWSGFAVDPELQALFFATSNNYTGKSSSMSDSLVAVNLKTGKVLWSRQVLAHDLWTRAEPLGPDYGFARGRNCSRRRSTARCGISSVLGRRAASIGSWIDARESSCGAIRLAMEVPVAASTPRLRSATPSTYGATISLTTTCRPINTR